MSQAGIVDFIGTHPEIPTMFVANVGVAVPIANTIELLGAAVAAHGVPLQTVASGNTVDFNIQYASATASSVAGNAGVASFDSAHFSVDANGFVTFSGAAGFESFTVDASTAPGTNPVFPDGTGNVVVTGGQVAAGTTTNVIRTDSLAANTYTIQIQRSQAVAASTVGDNGVSHFNSTYFTVDGNGFVSLNGSGVGETITGNSGGALSPTAGNWNIFGASVGAGTIPVATAGTGSTLTVNVQRSQAIASTNATNVGLAAFNSAQFAVDANGFVTLVGSGTLSTLSDDVGTTITPTAGNIQLQGHVNNQSGKFSTVVAGSHLLSLNPMSASRWIVDPLGFNGTHTTITSALTSATSGDTIFLMPGTYTENLTLKAGVNITAWISDSSLNGTGHVIIKGKCTFTSAGTVTISGIQLETNSDFLLAVTGSADSVIILTNCYLNCTNNTGISYTSSGANSGISLFRCESNLGTTGIALYSNSGVSGINIRYCDCHNSGASTTASNNSAGTVNWFCCNTSIPISTSSTASLNIFSCLFDTTSINTSSVTINSSGAIGIAFSSFITGTASSITITTGTASISHSCVYSTNTNAITGAGTINYYAISFLGASKLINTTTQNGGLLQGGISQAPSAGFIGEQIKSVVASPGNALANNSRTNLTSISLTAGVWDVTLVMGFRGMTTGTVIQANISTVSATGGSNGDNQVSFAALGQSTQDQCVSVPNYRLVLSTTTTVYAVGFALYTVGTGAFFGRISATRVG